jgi:alpha-tubulin suppressor-like RCC1 family protein
VLLLKQTEPFGFGGGNNYGEHGNGTNHGGTRYYQRSGGDNDWNYVASGQGYSIAIKYDRSLWAWGHNLYGQLGDGSNIDRYTPVQVGSSTDWAKIVIGNSHSVALKTNGSLWAWGRNDYGQLGDGSNIDKNTPVLINADTDWVDISAGYGHTVAIKADGSVWSWGVRQWYEFRW